MAKRKAAEALVVLAAAAFASAAFAAWPGMERDDKDRPEQGGRYPAEPCTDIIGLNSPSGGRMPAAPGTTFSDLTPPARMLAKVPGVLPEPLTIKSQAIRPEGPIPSKFTCEGEGVSPPLEWIDVSTRAKSLALVVDDPDSANGAATHWILYDLPANAGSLPEGVPPGPDGPLGSKQGRNDFGRLGWSAPCPSCGRHRFDFKLYALSAPTGLRAGASAKELLKAMKGKLVGRGEFIGRFEKGSR